MQSLKILLSFDHELSLGGARCFEQNMFRPTDALLSLADELQVPLNLFTDVCSAERFRDWEPESFFARYAEQIGAAVRGGHDVQLHLHPHWIDSVYAHGSFSPATTYSLGNFVDRPPPNDISGIVNRGIRLLHELCRSQDPGYHCVAFRAGGFCLTPCTAEILTALHDAGIRIESTIAKGFRFSCDLWSVDFSDMPEAANWTIPIRGPLNRPAACGLFEIPIATRPRTPVNNIPFLVKRVLTRGRRYDSGGWPIDAGNTSVPDKLKRLLPRSVWMLGFDHFADNVSDLMRTLRHHVEAHDQDDEIICSAISHPKMMGRHARGLMAKFVDRARREFDSALEFTTYQQIASERGLFSMMGGVTESDTRQLAEESR